MGIAVLVVAGFSVTACRLSDDGLVVFKLRFEPLTSRTRSGTDVWILALQNGIQQSYSMS
jgi:hypothetical protein